MEKKKILATIYCPGQLSGPSVSTYSVMNSYLCGKYCFATITISERLGSIPRVSVIKRLIKEIKNEDPDVIYISGLQLHGFYIVLAAKLAGYKKKTLLIVHGSACDNLVISRIKHYFFKHIIEPFTVRNSQITYTVCKEMANNPIVSRNCKRFGGVIHNAAPEINPDCFDRHVFREELNANESDVIAVFTGRIVADKGIQFLLESLIGIPKWIIVAIVGDGPDFDKYKNKAEELGLSNCFFLGRRNDVFSILAGSDLFVFPSLHENLPNSVVEACAMGLPVIATDVGGNTEIVRNNQNGLIVPANDSVALHDAIIKLATSKEDRARMGKESRGIIQNEFTQTVLYPKIEKLFDEIIETR